MIKNILQLKDNLNVWFVAVINSNENSDNLVLSFNKLRKLIIISPDEVKVLHKNKYSLLFRRFRNN